jgi:ABC-type branched-subunit amino acid transport system ATPase component
MSAVLLSARGLHAGYGDEDILRGVSIELKRGSVVAVIGPNGSGKSTLLKTIYGLVPLRRGQVTLFAEDGGQRDLTGLSPHKITACGVNMVPQIANVFPEMSVLENLEIGARPLADRFEPQLEKVLQALPLLTDLLRRRAATLSGGQRQMLAVARALMSDPRILILDEPSAGLAPAVQDEVFDKIKEINAAGVSILMVEQKARQCLAIADYAYVLDQGRNRFEGAAADLLHDADIARLYLGAKMTRKLSAVSGYGDTSTRPTSPQPSPPPGAEREGPGPSGLGG